jgi:hypothetical protein
MGFYPKCRYIPMKNILILSSKIHDKNVEFDSQLDSQKLHVLLSDFYWIFGDENTYNLHNSCIASLLKLGLN